jgi:hypothetical protein
MKLEKKINFKKSNVKKKSKHELTWRTCNSWYEIGIKKLDLKLQNSRVNNLMSNDGIKKKLIS